MEDQTPSQRIANLYGPVDWLRATGILHVAAVSGAPPHVIAIGPSAPASPLDRFALGFARARADAILTTGSILRAEPELVHCYAEAPLEEAALRQWRSRVLGKKLPPALVVVSGSGDFPVDHPALAAAETGLIWTTQEGRERLRASRVAGLPVEVPRERVDSLRASVCAAIERVRSVIGARTILIEAGPTIAETLYPDSDFALGVGKAGAERSDGEWVDELLLSRFDGELDERAIGPAFPSEARIASLLGDRVSLRHVEEASGGWHFERFRRG